MLVVNDDNSICVTRGDIAFFSVEANNNGETYTFQSGDVVRIKVYEKKGCENVVLQKDFPIEKETDRATILLTEQDTKIGEVISKPRDYWYEIELNPFDNPQTIIGYDDGGAKVFKLYPEGDDLQAEEPEEEEIPIVDEELNLTSTRPVQNRAISREIVILREAVKEATEVANGITPETIGAAPAGFGLGTNVAQDFSFEDVDDVTKNGWYRTNAAGTYIDGVEVGYARMFVHCWDANSVQQKLHIVALCCELSRCRNVDGWGQWEWINPPMVPGVEYRTEERYMGKVVYTTLVYGGVPPTEGNKEISYSSSSSAKAIRHSGSLGDCSIPYEDNNGWSASALTVGPYVRLYASANWAALLEDGETPAYPWYHQVWYTKD